MVGAEAGWNRILQGAIGDSFAGIKGGRHAGLRRERL